MLQCNAVFICMRRANSEHRVAFFFLATLANKEKKESNKWSSYYTMLTIKTNAQMYIIRYGIFYGNYYLFFFLFIFIGLLLLRAGFSMLLSNRMHKYTTTNNKHQCSREFVVYFPCLMTVLGLFCPIFLSLSLDIFLAL